MEVWSISHPNIINIHKQGVLFDKNLILDEIIHDIVHFILFSHIYNFQNIPNILGK